jgi:hypothetical protein
MVCLHGAFYSASSHQMHICSERKHLLAKIALSEAHRSLVQQALTSTQIKLEGQLQAG